MSLIYASGNRATALANIISQVNSRISYNAAGVKVLDAQGLADWLRDQFNLVATTDGTPPNGAAAVQRAVDGLAVGNLVAPLRAALNPDRWKTRSDWPGDPVRFQQNKTSALLNLQFTLKRDCQALQSQYETIKQDLITSLPYEYEKGIVPKLPTAVARIIETRAYIVTYVTDRGEESAPSDASALVDVDQNDTVTVTVPAPPSGRHVTHFRLYRTSASTTSSAFQYVPAADDLGFPVGTLTVTDDKLQEELGEPCETLSWDEPPAGLTGLFAMPNGIVGGAVGTRLYFCEPFTPYAFPLEYMQTLDHEFVAAGTFGNTSVILTKGNPVYASGADSASITLQRMESNQSCVSARSVASSEGGVFYVSPDGLCLAGPAGVVVLTTDAFTQEEWRALGLTDCLGRYHDGVYYLFLSSGTTYAFDVVRKRITTMSQAATGAYSDLITDTLYAASGTSLIPLFRAAPLMARWRSPVMVMNRHLGLSWLRVRSDFESPVVVRYYGNGVLRATLSFSSDTPKRLPAGRWREIEFEIESSARVVELVGATSSGELGP